MENNIFTYATSELSQDAFLLYLLNYAKIDGNEGKFARDMLKAFSKKNNKDEFINENNYNDYEIYSYKQYLNIDVLMVFINKKNEENSFFLIIEDKIKAGESKEDQLKSYIEKIKNKKEFPKKDINNKTLELDDNLRNIRNIIFEKNILSIYFKSGFLQTGENKDNHLFGIEDIIQLVDRHNNCNNIVIKQWIEKIKQKKDEIKKVKQLINEENDKTTLNDLLDRVNNKGYDAININNALSEFLFNPKTEKYEVFKLNAFGHPETCIDYCTFNKDISTDNFEINNVTSARFALFLRITNFELKIVFEIHYDYTDNKGNKKSSWVKRGLKGLKDNGKNEFKEEKKNLYEDTKKKIEELDNDNVKLGDIENGNITMAKFNDNIQKLSIKELKEIIIEIKKIFTKIAKQKTYKEDKPKKEDKYQH